MRQEQVEERHANQREEDRQRNAPEDGNGERLLHLSARANPEGEGREACDRGEGGHQDRPQAHAAGADEGSVDVIGAGGVAGGEVEEQDAVLGDDADHHDHAHHRRYIEGGAGRPEGGEASGEREAAADHNGEGRGDRAELDQQHGHDTRDGRQEYLDELREGLLLACVQAPILQPDAGGQDELARERGAHVARDGSEVATFEPCRNAHQLAQVLARPLYGDRAGTQMR